MNQFCTVEEALEEIKAGRPIILVDNPNRENEADFYLPSDKITPEIVTLMIKQGGGLLCAAITQNQANRLKLPLMVPPNDNTEKTHVNFTVSVNAKKGISTGVSSFDRVKTIQVLSNPNSKPDDLTRPGHVFGLLARPLGVLEREGHTEAAVDLARLVNLNPSGVLCEIINGNGKMASQNDLVKLAQKLAIKILAIADLIKYLKSNPLPKPVLETEVIKTAQSNLPTKYGLFKIKVYRSMSDNLEEIALCFGDINQTKSPILTRIHSKCLTGDTFGSLKCDCGAQLEKSLQLISQKGGGIIIYLNQEGRGIGLENKIKAYSLQDQGYDTIQSNHLLGFPTDTRDYKIAADILKDLKITKIVLLTNNPDKECQLLSQDIEIIKTIPLEIESNKYNHNYLLTKKNHLGHRLKLT